MANKDERRFKRRLFGYQRSAVDSHLEGVEVTIDLLRADLDTQDAERAELVLRATRQSVEAVMADAYRRAEDIVATFEGGVAAIDRTRPADTPELIDLRAAADSVDTA